MLFCEGMYFYVTAASVRELPWWLGGEWIMSCIVERHTTFTQARDAVWSYNQHVHNDGEPGCFYFVSSNKALT